MVARAVFTPDPNEVIGTAERRLFGSFVEHIGRCVYGGIYDPENPFSDKEGFRSDVVEMVKELGVSVVRYPGGNFVSGYRWEDGVGPLEERPVRLDLAWRSVESNAFGLGEFMKWSKRVGVEPMIALNLGTRGIQEALDLLEYCNHPGGTRLSDLRKSHGHKEPFRIRTWCLGNELDGPWQIGHKNASEYGRLAAETARAMRMFDPALELVACGSSGSGMPTFGSWERTVLDHAFEEVDLISAHSYFEEIEGDRFSFLSSAVDLSRTIEKMISIADQAAAAKRSTKKLGISFDEWNVWYLSRYLEANHSAEWRSTPRLCEDEFTVVDGVVVGSLLMALLRHCDRVRIACLAQLVNAIAPIHCEPDSHAWRQTTFFPFSLTARHAVGCVLAATPVSPVKESKLYGEVPMIDALATHDPERRTLAVFVVNRSSERGSFTLNLGGFRGFGVIEVKSLFDEDSEATNSNSDPNRVMPRTLNRRGGDQGIEVDLPPVSWTMIRLAGRIR